MSIKAFSISLICALVAVPFFTGPQTARADGDLAVSVSNGNLKIQGINNTNHTVFLAATNTVNSIQVLAFDGTTFNGQSSLTVAGVTGNVEINLKSGEALVVLTESDQPNLNILGDLKIKTTGDAPAIVILDNVFVAGRTTISTKNGDDAIIFFTSIFGDRLQLKTGNGADTFAGLDIAGEDLRVQTGNGDDDVILGLSGGGKLDVKTGNQNDVLGVYSSTFSELKANGNGGVDTFYQDNFNMFYVEPVPKGFEFMTLFNLNDAITNTESTSPTFAAAVAIFVFFDLTN